MKKKYDFQYLHWVGQLPIWVDVTSQLFSWNISETNESTLLVLTTQSCTFINNPKFKNCINQSPIGFESLV
jgi:hypothetical protein